MRSDSLRNNFIFASSSEVNAIFFTAHCIPLHFALLTTPNAPLPSSFPISSSLKSISQLTVLAKTQIRYRLLSSTVMAQALEDLDAVEAGVLVVLNHQNE